MQNQMGDPLAFSVEPANNPMGFALHTDELTDAVGPVEKD